MAHAIMEQTGLTKYHLGCGTIFLKGWLNIGYWSQFGDDQLFQAPNGVEGTIMMNRDLRRGIPAEDGTLDAIYHAHFLEHLSFKDGVSMLKQCYDKLKPGGVHRILVPDLEAFARSYLDKSNILIDKYQEHVLSKELDLYHTRGAVFMGMLHNHEHKMGYDWDTMSYLLEKTGFKDIKRTLFQESYYLDDIMDIETYSPVRALESLCIECRK